MQEIKIGAYFWVLIVSAIFTSLSIASASNDDKLLLSTAANARVIEVLPRTCINATPDIYVASAASTIYLKGEILTVYYYFKELDLSQYYENLGEFNEAQKRLVIEYLSNLYKVRSAAEHKYKFLESARNGFATAESIALKEFSIHQRKFLTCYDEMNSAKSGTSGAPGCGDCNESITKVTDLMTFYKNRHPATALPTTSVQKQKVKVISNQYNEEIHLNCAKLTCAPSVLPLKEACPPLRKSVIKNNSVTCYPEKIIQTITRNQKNNRIDQLLSFIFNQAYASVDPIKEIWNNENTYELIEKENKAQLNTLKENASYVVDNWVTFVKDRIFLFATMKKETASSMIVVENKVKKLSARIQEVEQLLGKMGEDVAKLELDYALNIQSPSPFKDCVTKECTSFTKIMEFKSRDLPKLPPIHVETFKKFGETADLIKQGKLDPQVLGKVDSLNSKAATIDNFNRDLKAAIEKHYQELGQPVEIDRGVEKLLEDKRTFLAEVTLDSNNPISRFIAEQDIDEQRPKRPSSDILPPPTIERVIETEVAEREEPVDYQQKEAMEDAQIGKAISIPEFVHNKEKSIWDIISRAYFKIYQ